MKQSLLHVALIVRDYDEAIEFFVTKLRFNVVEDTFLAEQNKRWVLVSPPGSLGTNVLLAKAATDEQRAFVGNQTGGRVAFFLGTDDFWRDYHAMRSAGVTFVREPKSESHGTVAVFEDLYGNRWDLLERKSA
jgi:catechol 2,3-dioxygenase-like lactoylglutathione lyase family enzyme